MGLFGKSKLEKEVEKLKDRVRQLEVDTRVVYYVPYKTWDNKKYFDHRTIGVADAVELLVDHLGLDIQKPSSTKAKIVKKKAKKSKK